VKRVHDHGVVIITSSQSRRPKTKGIPIAWPSILSLTRQAILSKCQRKNTRLITSIGVCKIRHCIHSQNRHSTLLNLGGLVSFLPSRSRHTPILFLSTHFWRKLSSTYLVFMHSSHSPAHRFGFEVVSGSGSEVGLASGVGVGGPSVVDPKPRLGTVITTSSRYSSGFRTRA